MRPFAPCLSPKKEDPVDSLACLSHSFDNNKLKIYSFLFQQFENKKNYFNTFTFLLVFNIIVFMNVVTDLFSKPSIAKHTDAKMHYHSPLLNSPWVRVSFLITAFATIGIILAGFTAFHPTVLYACGGSLAGIGVLSLLGLGLNHLCLVYQIKKLLKQKDSNFYSTWNAIFAKLNPGQSLITDIDNSGARYVLHKTKNKKQKIHVLIPDPSGFFLHVNWDQFGERVA